MKTAIAGIVIVIIVALGGWYVWSTMQTPAPTPIPTFGSSPTTTTATQGLPTGSSNQTGDGSSISENLTLGIDSAPAFGKYLIGYTGMTLYYYVPDNIGLPSNATSTCYGQCAQIWPPYTIPAGMHLNLQAGVNGQASTIIRADGTTQVVYDGHPLYFYSGDQAGSDVNGEGLGGVWFVIKP